MRDYETFEAAIRAAETGHLVFDDPSARGRRSAVSTTCSPRTSGTRSGSSTYNLRAIVYQKLLPTLHKNIPRSPPSRSSSTLRRSKYILSPEGELLQIIKQSLDEGMVDFTSSLVRLVEEEYIHQDVG